MFFKLILVFLFIVMSCSGEISRKSTALTKAVSSLQKKYNIQLIGFGGAQGSEKRVRQEFLDFSVPELLTVKYGRELIFSIVDDLIYELNNSDEDQFKNLSYANFKITLLNNYQERLRDHNYPYLYAVVFSGNKFIYMYDENNSENNKSYNETESLEEALKNK